MRPTCRGTRRNQRGFTLVESMVALLLALIVGMAFYRLYIHERKQYLSQQNAAELQQNTRFILASVPRDDDPARATPR